MRKRMVASMLLSCLIASPCAHAGAESAVGVWDGPSFGFPGKYFEQKAQFYLRNKDYGAALNMFELSGFWADKMSQYNVGIMYYSGVGVAADKPRGAAWLAIAAESHEDLAERARQVAYDGLSDAERRRADEIFHELDGKYGDAVALPRALTRYSMDMNVSLFKIGGIGESYTCAGVICGVETGSEFLHRMQQQRDELIGQITGHVRVGAVQALDVAPEARRNASAAVLVAEPPAPKPIDTR